MLTIIDAVRTSVDASNDTVMVSLCSVSRKSFRAVLGPAQAAVAGIKPEDIDSSAFDAAHKAAMDAVDDSFYSFQYRRADTAIMSALDRIVWMAARQASCDLFAKMSKAGREDGHLLGEMNIAAVREAKIRLGQDDSAAAVREATHTIQNCSRVVISELSKVVPLAVAAPVASTAIFEASIQDVPATHLSEAIAKACRNLPGLASNQTDGTVDYVATFAASIAKNVERRPRYQTAVRGIERFSQKLATFQASMVVADTVFEAVYMMLVVAAYATGDRSVFEANYEKILAYIYEGDLPQSRHAKKSSPEDNSGISELHRKQPDESGQLPAFVEEDLVKRSYLRTRIIDYKKISSEPWMESIILLYRMAYRAGHIGASAVKRPAGSRRQKRRLRSGP